jgi:hypothetical protein
VDEGSNTTLFRDGFVRQVGASGDKMILNVSGVGDHHNQYSSELVQLEVETVTLKGYTLSAVASTSPPVDWEEVKSRFPYLRDLPLASSGRRPDILLGLDHAHLLLGTEFRGGLEGQPIASKTKVGWIVRGVWIGHDAKAHNVRVNSALAGPNYDALAVAS